MGRPWLPGEYAASDPLKLQRRLQRILALAFMGRVPRLNAGYICHGQGGRLEHFEESPRYVATPRVYYPLVRAADLEFAADHAEFVSSLMSPREDFYRLRNGLLSFDALMRAEYASDRLHMAVRSLDGVLATRPGRGEADFVERGQYLIGQGQAGKSILSNLYRIRNHVEHLKDPVSYVKGLNPPVDDPVREAFQLSFQAELIASHAWKSLLPNSTLRPNFHDELAIDRFWLSPADSLRSAWPEPLDLRSAVEARFHGEQDALYEVEV